MGPGRQLQGKHFQAGGFYKNIPEEEKKLSEFISGPLLFYSPFQFHIE